MRLIKLLTNLLLAVLLALSASTAVSAKVASGSQNLVWTGHQAENVFNWLTCQGKSDRSTTGPPECSVVPKGVEGFNPKYWNTPIESAGRSVYQRNDLFDLTPENLSRMQKGRPPIGRDGEPVNLHHLTQNEPGAIAEVGGKFHSDNTKTLHGLTEPKGSFRYSSDGKTTEAEKAFRRWSYRYWQDRSKGLQ